MDAITSLPRRVGTDHVKAGDSWPLARGDPTGDPSAVDVDAALRDALRHPKSRSFVLRLETRIESYLAEPQRPAQLIFPYAHTSYERLLAHRVAQHWGLNTRLLQSGPDHGLIAAAYGDDPQTLAKRSSDREAANRSQRSASPGLAGVKEPSLTEAAGLPVAEAAAPVAAVGSSRQPKPFHRPKTLLRGLAAGMVIAGGDSNPGPHEPSADPAPRPPPQYSRENGATPHGGPALAYPHPLAPAALGLAPPAPPEEASASARAALLNAKRVGARSAEVPLGAPGSAASSERLSGAPDSSNATPATLAGAIFAPGALPPPGPTGSPTSGSLDEASAAAAAALAGKPPARSPRVPKAAQSTSIPGGAGTAPLGAALRAEPRRPEAGRPGSASRAPLARSPSGPAMAPARAPVAPRPTAVGAGAACGPDAAELGAPPGRAQLQATALTPASTLLSPARQPAGAPPAAYAAAASFYAHVTSQWCPPAQAPSSPRRGGGRGGGGGPLGGGRGGGGATPTGSRPGGAPYRLSDAISGGGSGRGTFRGEGGASVARDGAADAGRGSGQYARDSARRSSSRGPASQHASPNHPHSTLSPTDARPPSPFTPDTQAFGVQEGSGGSAAGAREGGSAPVARAVPVAHAHATAPAANAHVHSAAPAALRPSLAGTRSRSPAPSQVAAADGVPAAQPRGRGTGNGRDGAEVGRASPPAPSPTDPAAAPAASARGSPIDGTTRHGAYPLSQRGRAAATKSGQAGAAASPLQLSPSGTAIGAACAPTGAPSPAPVALTETPPCEGSDGATGPGSDSATSRPISATSTDTPSRPATATGAVRDEGASFRSPESTRESLAAPAGPTLVIPGSGLPAASPRAAALSRSPVAGSHHWAGLPGGAMLIPAGGYGQAAYPTAYPHPYYVDGYGNTFQVPYMTLQAMQAQAASAGTQTARRAAGAYATRHGPDAVASGRSGYSHASQANGARPERRGRADGDGGAAEVQAGGRTGSWGSVPGALRGPHAGQSQAGGGAAASSPYGQVTALPYALYPGAGYAGVYAGAYAAAPAGGPSGYPAGAGSASVSYPGAVYAASPAPYGSPVAYSTNGGVYMTSVPQAYLQGAAGALPGVAGYPAPFAHAAAGRGAVAGDYAAPGAAVSGPPASYLAGGYPAAAVPGENAAYPGAGGPVAAPMAYPAAGAATAASMAYPAAGAAGPPYSARYATTLPAPYQGASTAYLLTAGSYERPSTYTHAPCPPTRQGGVAPTPSRHPSLGPPFKPEGSGGYAPPYQTHRRISSGRRPQAERRAAAPPCHIAAEHRAFSGPSSSTSTPSPGTPAATRSATAE